MLGQSRKTSAGLRLAAIVCASLSLVALVAHVFGTLPMDFFLTFFGVPAAMLLLILGVVARRLDEAAFVTDLVVGLIGGFVATVAYDAFRLVINVTHLFDYNGFVAIYIFGSWITEQPVSSLEAGIAGWIYHFWNGLSFGVCYALTFGNRHWVWGLGYGMFMEACMLGLFPIFLQVSNQAHFIVVSMLGHMVYGTVLGLVAQRHARGLTGGRVVPGV
jgi:hypothetical protein